MKRRYLTAGLIALASIFCSGLGIKNIQTKNAFAEEISMIALERDFDGSSVLVTMTEEMSEINKVYSPSFFGNIEIESVEDLTYIEGNIEEKLYLNRDSFQQILQLHLPIDSKENVLSVIQEVEQISGVEEASPNYYEECTSIPSDSYYNRQWGLHETNGINAPSAWDITTGSQDVKVGVIDTGIAAHPDLNANLATGYDFVNNDTTTTDDPTGHGTHVAGIIGAVGNNDKGISGVCLKVTLVPLQVCQKYYIINGNEIKQEWRAKTSAVTEAITYAIWNNIPILNYSFGGYDSQSEEFLERETEIKNYTGLFVCSAGNESNNNDTTKHYPSNYADETNADYNEFSDRVISVGSITESGSRATSSNYGINSVSIYAPGGSIYSTIPNNSYGYKSGTSMAAPHVAGVAALMMAVNPNVSAATIKDKILASADTITITLPNNTTQQVKKLNAYKAVCDAAYIRNAVGNEIIGIHSFESSVLEIPSVIGGVTITSIGDSAFANQIGMTSVTIPDTVTNLGEEVFKNCTSLSSVSLSENLINIENRVFLECINLTSLIIPSTVTSIGVQVFNGCTGLTALTVDSGNGTYRSSGNCIIRKSDNVVVLGYEQSTIPNGVTKIGDYAFCACDITNLIIPASVTYIGEHAFDGSGLIEISLPASVAYIDRYAFANCTALEAVYIEGLYPQTPVIAMPEANESTVFPLNENFHIFVYDDETAVVYKDHGNWNVYAAYIHLYYNDVESLEWVLVTDESIANPSVSAVMYAYSFANVYTGVTVTTFEPLMETLEGQAVLVYATGYLYTNINEFYEYLETIAYQYSGLVYCTDYALYSYTPTGGRVIEDSYSLGYEVATEYLAEADDVDVEQMIDEIGYFPVIAPSWYRNNVLFLMGLSDVFGGQVKVFSTIEEVETEFDRFQELGYCDFENWLMVEITDYEYISVFEENDVNTAKIFVFLKDLTVVTNVSGWDVKLYKIETFCPMLETVAIKFCNGEDVGSMDEFEAFAADRIEEWEALNYTDFDYEERRENIWSPLWVYWTELGYTVSEDTWRVYWYMNWEVSGTGGGAFHGVEDFDGYWELYKSCYMELKVRLVV